jgi:hypothetical protein
LIGGGTSPSGGCGDGDPFSAREKARIKDAVESGQMPPPTKGKLSPAEKAAFQFGPAVSNKEFPK